MHAHPDREKTIRARGIQLLAALGNAPAIFSTQHWQGSVIAGAMKDEPFKAQLLRFIDVLPGIKTDSLVLQLFREYFGQTADAPLIIRYGMKRLSRRDMVPRIAASVIRQAIISLARQFIAGRNPDDAFRSLRTLAEDGARLSLDLLGEAVLSDVEADRYAGRYLELLKSIAPRLPASGSPHQENNTGLDISLKVSSLYSQMDPLNWEGSISRAKENLRPLFHLAASLNASITFDMEQYYLKDLTIALFKDILGEFRGFRNAGIALQAYLKDTRQDLLNLLKWAETDDRRITIRLVKGAYWDYETVVNRQRGWPVPVFLDKGDTERNFEELTTILLKNADRAYPAIATHNIRSISHAMTVAEELNLASRDFEFQTLYGIGEPIRRALREMPVRVYCPVGELIPGMAYLIRRILENTSNESFMRKSFGEKQPSEVLVNPPLPAFRTSAEKIPDGFRNEPATDFSKTENRAAIKHALAEARNGFGKRYPLFIGDREVFTERQIRSMNPAQPDELIGSVSSASGTEAEEAVREAGTAYASWKKTPPKKRVDYLFRAAEVMRKQRHDLTALEIYETGKTVSEADADVAEAIDYLEYYGRQMLALAQPRYPGRYPGEINEYRYEPRGIAVVISPWNFPLALPTGMASAAIVAGNCAILKPSGLSPITAWRLVDIFRTVGLPRGVLQYLPGPGAEVGEYLAAHPGIGIIAFTGSKDVGLKIVKIAGDTRPGQAVVKRVIAEMGGKNAIIVDDTADLDEAVKGTLESSLGYQGQKCSACSRVIVLKGVYHEFCERLKEAMKSVKIGPPDEPATFMGPLIDSAAFKRVQEYIAAGKKKGSPMLVREAALDGYYVGPALFEVPPGDPLSQEEIFGPVVALMHAEDMDEALTIANSTAYALTGGLYSRSPEHIRKAGNEFRAGNLYINRKITGALVGRQPFGGLGLSGIGSKAGGPDYLQQFMNPVSLSENTLRKGFATLPPEPD